ncbi:NADH-quinone oxidoreductase subunit N [Sphaerisporangium melleum]|uniref:NADH-quinone oxidoreductase subunit N n=1 Tax=Sphaerisporangium melleum TaxID=321316 RepID=A0A917VHP5_9ACTN|nr:NADH-quinone oxidoreductase subunit N [Sphaerisporangium melleum]GGK79144.1 NADH-quinone oxidoreductase subunit N [Sphaerisporangium melleum]GII69739.1 NADH-quinone oxidoreductase subunit N [Sphaerisporangium melleum]
MIQSIDYAAIASPLVLALMAGVVLLLDAFLPRTGRTRTTLGLVTLAGVLAALAVPAVQALSGARLRTFCVPAGLSRDPGPPPCSFVVDHLTLVFGAVALAAGVVVVLLSMAQLAESTIPPGEWYFLLLCTLAGAVTLPASRDLIMLVIALELVSLPVFALAALKRYDARGSEAALKMFLVSVVSTAVMLFGVSLLYGLTGSVHLSAIAARLAAAPVAPGASVPPAVPVGVLTVAVVLVLAGFAFKIAAVPFHFWAGDVYQGAPVPVAALLSVISKAAGFAGLILVLTTALAGQARLWGPVVAVLAALTMTAGNLLALRQRHAVRLLAWSSVAQSGYILAPLGVAGKQAVPASVAYLVIYAAMNIGAFAVVAAVSREGGRNELDDYRGLAFRAPVPALALAFFLVCLAGLPPGLSGMFAKIVVFREIVAGGAGWLAVVMAVNTVIALYYYIAWTARLFTPASAPAPSSASGPAASALTIAITLGLVASVAFSVAPQLVLSIAG